MSHKPITLKNVSLIVGEKSCFEHFNKQIHSGKHIVIMGINGAGKSTLLKIDPNQLNSNGRSALDYAEQSNNPEIYALLINAGAE